jgi:hypothetical protein
MEVVQLERPNAQGLAAGLRPSPTPPSVGLVVIPKRKKAPILRAARRSATTRCWTAAWFKAFVCDISDYDR